MGLREYARHRAAEGLPGGTHRAVQVAIKDGRLRASLTRDRKKVKSAKAADAEWLLTTKFDMRPVTGPTSQARIKSRIKNRPKDTNGTHAPTAKQESGGSAPRIKPEDEAPPVNDFAVARARREAAAARRAELEVDREEALLVRAKDVEARLADVFLRCRTRLLGIPTRAREQDPSLGEPQLKLFETLINEACEELAGGGR